MSKTKHITVRASISLLVLNHLVSKVVRFLVKVPVLNCSTSTTAPTSELLDCVSKREEVCADSGNPGKRLESSPSCFKVTELGGKRQCKDGWIVLWGTARIRDLNNPLDDCDSILLDQVDDILGVSLSHLLFRGVITSTLVSKD